MTFAMIGHLQNYKIGNIVSLTGIVFFSTTATVMVTAVWTLFLVEQLHLTPVQIGWIEGSCVCVGLLSKVLSGIVSDYLHRHKGIIVIGTLLSIVSKSCFALATGFLSAFCVKFLDRIAKGLRSCPSDAILADMSSKHHNLIFSLKYLLFSCGAICGGAVAHTILRMFPNHYRLVFFIAIIPTVIAFILSKFCVYENSEESLFDKDQTHYFSSIQENLRFFPVHFWKFLSLVFLIMFSRFSESFLIMKAKNLGIDPPTLSKLIPFYDVFALIGIGLSAGILCKVHKILILALAMLIQLCAHGIAFISVNETYLTCSIAFFGLHLGMSQGILISIIASFSFSKNRGTAFAVYYFVSSMGLLLSNLLAGRLCQVFQSPSIPFFGGACFAAATLLLLKVFKDPKASNELPNQP